MVLLGSNGRHEMFLPKKNVDLSRWRKVVC